MENEKTIYFFDLDFEGKTDARSIGGVKKPKRQTLNKTFFEVIKDLKDFIENKRGGYYFHVPPSKYYIVSKVSWDKDYYKIMVDMIKGDLSNIITRDIVEGDIKSRDKLILEGKGIEYSSHILISRKADQNGKHLVLFEKSENVTFSESIKYLNRQLKTMTKNDFSYHQPHFGGISNKKMIVYPMLTFSGHPSNRFKEEINKGELTVVELLMPPNSIAGLDQGKSSLIKKTTVSVDLSSIGENDNNHNFLKSKISGLASTIESDEVKVKFTDSTNQIRIAKLDSKMGLVDSEEFIKKHKIKLEGFVFDTSYSDFDDKIIKEMKNLV